ncbi:hypothetical protein F4803DRAFT_531870 [Xylaria telfairii]|nr:hypothetical protein F4803DRAFT_531870 [Xylaria telfairii]
MPMASRGVNIQGDVNNTRAQAKIILGNINGIAFIAETINFTIKSATNLIGTIGGFTDRVATISKRLESLADTVKVASRFLDHINELVTKQARKEGLEGTKGGTRHPPKADKIFAVNNMRHEAQNDPDVLQMQCFTDLVKACNGARTSFEDMTQKIDDARSMLPQTSTDSRTPEEDHGTMHELTTVNREKMFLQEDDIEFMEKEVQAHRMELQLWFTVFQAILNDEKLDGVKSTMLHIYRTIESLADYLTGGILYGQSYARGGHANMRPLAFVHLSRLASLYMCWKFSTSKQDCTKSKYGSSGSSSSFSLPVKIALSTEELYLKVLAQSSERAKRRRTLLDDYEEFSRSESRRALVDNLRTDQNAILQADYPQLMWVLAGLEYVERRIWWRVQEPTTITVILKTQFDPEYQQGCPRWRQGLSSMYTSTGRVSETKALVPNLYGGPTGDLSEVRSQGAINSGQEGMRRAPTTKPRPFASQRRSERSRYRQHTTSHEEKRVSSEIGGKYNATGRNGEGRGYKWRSWGGWGSTKDDFERRNPKNSPRRRIYGGSFPSTSAAPIFSRLRRGDDSDPPVFEPDPFAHSRRDTTSPTLEDDCDDDEGGKIQEMTAEDSKVTEEIKGEWGGLLDWRSWKDRRGREGAEQKDGVIRRLMRRVESESQKRMEEERRLKESNGFKTRIQDKKMKGVKVYGTPLKEFMVEKKEARK